MKKAKHKKKHTKKQKTKTTLPHRNSSIIVLVT